MVVPIMVGVLLYVVCFVLGYVFTTWMRGRWRTFDPDRRRHGGSR